MDASSIQSYLEQHASSSNPLNPALEVNGHGYLTMGNPPPSATTGAGYVGLATPQRVLDTRTANGPTGGQPMQPGQTVVASIPSSVVPAGATAVAINLTGAGATGGTFLSTSPTGWRSGRTPRT